LLCARNKPKARRYVGVVPTGNEQTAIARQGSAFGGFIAVPTLLILAAAAVYAIGDAVIAEAPAPKNPGLVDGVLASRAVIAAIRIAIIAAAGYVVISVVALVTRRQWLTRVGPVEVSEQVLDIDEENAELKSRLKREREKTEGLMAELAAADAMLTATARREREQR
jgi:hypothetical protein